ncbi:MAG TPA: hypothetical protein VHX65_15205 [Pirellulales bacterium]|nr:hypothetical protein [Pirellulales bacterium]
MANVYSIAYTVLGVVVAHCCLLVWTALLLPGPVDRARRRIELRPLTSFLVGLVCFLTAVCLWGGFSLLRARLVPRVDDWLEYLSVHLQFTRTYNDAWILTNAFFWLLMIPFFAAFIFGEAGFSQIFAIRARGMMRDDRPLLCLTYGASCTSVSYFLPLIGWFVFLPIVGLISVGAGICGMLGFGSARVGESRTASARRQEPLFTGR